MVALAGSDMDDKDYHIETMAILMATLDEAAEKQGLVETEDLPA